MAKCHLSAKELVGEIFSPRVAILSSPSAQTLCETNGLNFTQLIQPFTTLTTFHTWQEPGGTQIIPKCLKIIPVDIASWKPPVQDTQRNRQIQYGVVSQTPPPLRLLTDREGSGNGNDDEAKNLQFKTYNMKGKNTSAISSGHSVEVPASTPWFEVWRETALRLYSEQNMGQYEFFCHFISCILVISTSEVRNIEELTNIVGKLSKLQQQHQTEWPQTWLLSSVLKFYILLHDNSVEDSTGAEAVYQHLRTTYGGNFCYMLKINTANHEGTTVSPNPWACMNHGQQKEPTLNNGDGIDLPESVHCDVMPHPLSPSEESPSFLPQNGVSQSSNFVMLIPNISLLGRTTSPEDIRSIQTAVNEFLGKALLPYIERQCRILHESIVNRRSMSKSFFGATKRLFGSSARSPGLTIYTKDSPEIVSRKLADLYFLFGHYSGAYHLYHQLKKDFNADQAWIHYASALEMSAVSHFMMTQAEGHLVGARSFPVHYISESIKYYMENSRMIDAAIRCTIMCCECLKELDNYPMAAEIYIQMTSEECDVRSALMLEQAAYAFLHMNSPRKFALHSVLAGHRYGKAGLKVHSLNSYIQAGQIYGGRGWRLAEDHVNSTIARQQSLLQLHSGLAKYLKSLLKYPTPQPAGQIKIYYKEFLNIMTKLYEENKTPEEFEIPKMICSEIRIRIGNTGLQTGELPNFNFNETIPATYWDTLEEHVVRERINKSVITFKPSRMLFQQGTDNTVHPTVPCNEYFYIEIPLQNLLSIEISLQNLGLKFDPESSVSSTIVNELCFQPGDIKVIRFAVASSREGRIKFVELLYQLQLGATIVPFKQKVIMKGPRLNSTKAERYGRIYAKDLRNDIIVIDQMPLLQAEVEGLPSTLFQTQFTKFSVVLRDKSMDITDRKRISQVILCSENMNDFLEVIPDPLPTELLLGDTRKNYCPIAVTLDGLSTVRIPCLYKSPQQGDCASVNLLVLYEIRRRESHSHKKHSSLYRIIKMCIKVPLLPCLTVEFHNLKTLDTAVSLDLLNVQNLTKDSSIQLEGLNFTPEDARTIEELNYLPRQEFLDSQIKMDGTESLNIVMKTRRKEPSEPEDLCLNLKWTFSLPTDGHNPNKNSIFGNYKLQLNKLSKVTLEQETKVEKPLFIFQIRHIAKNTHDFNNFPSYVCPVELLIHPKQLGKFELTIGRATEVASDIVSTSAGTKASSQDVFFIGQTRWILEFSDLRTKILAYKVALTRPGIYNVGPTISVKRIHDSDTGDVSDFEEQPLSVQTLHSPIIIAQSIFLTDPVTLD